MDYRTPLQTLLHQLLPSRMLAVRAARANDFEDTRPDESRAAASPASGQSAPVRRLPDVRSQSAIDLVVGTEIMEYEDDTSADLMDEFFAKSDKRAA